MRKIQGWSCPHGFSSISQFLHKSSHISCRRKVNFITRSTPMQQSLMYRCKRVQVKKSQFKTLFCISQLRKAEMISLSKKEHLSFVCSYIETDKDATTSSRAVLPSKGTPESPLIQMRFYIKRQQASKKVLLAYWKVSSSKAGYHLSLNITNTHCKIYSP